MVQKYRDQAFLSIGSQENGKAFRGNLKHTWCLGLDYEAISSHFLF